MPWNLPTLTPNARPETDTTAAGGLLAQATPPSQRDDPSETGEADPETLKEPWQMEQEEKL